MSNPRALQDRLPQILFAGWMVPGAAHLMIGEQKKGRFLLILLLGTFIVGAGMAYGRCVDYERHPLTFAAQAGMGLPFMVSWGLTRYLPTLETPAPLEQLGLLYTAIASLLNLLVVLNAYERVVKLNLPPKKDKDAKESKDKGKKGKKGKGGKAS